MLVRTERWHGPADNQRKLVKYRWPEIGTAATAPGVPSVRLCGSTAISGMRSLSLLSVANRIVPPDPCVPDFMSMPALKFSLSLGRIFGDRPSARVFDRTHRVLTTWFSSYSGNPGAPSLCRIDPHPPWRIAATAFVK